MLSPGGMEWTKAVQQYMEEIFFKDTEGLKVGVFAHLRWQGLENNYVMMIL
jgi:hypothetical protein